MNVNPPETDDELFVRLRGGEEAAFVALYRKRQGAIYRFALHMSGLANVAEDVTQEVFLALLQDRCGYDRERGTLSGYLYGIARKLLLRQMERGRVDVPLESGSEDAALPQLAVDDNALDDLTHREGIEALHRAIRTLPRRYREVVVLCDLEEVDYADAANVLGCPIGTVRSRLHRARALLLDKLNQERQIRPPVSALKAIRCLT
jgi:RNA polymerase sigma-70 factor (ECF subfamily)